MSVQQSEITWGEITSPPGAGQGTLGHVHTWAVPALLLPTPDSTWGDTVISVLARSCVQKCLWKPTEFTLEHITQNYESCLLSII